MTAITTLRPMVDAKNPVIAERRSQRRLSLRLEFIALVPRGKGARAGHVAADAVGENVVFNHSVELPFGRDHVARLVVAGLAILGFLLLAPSGGASDVGLPGLEVERGNADCARS